MSVRLFVVLGTFLIYGGSSCLEMGNITSEWTVPLLDNSTDILNAIMQLRLFEDALDYETKKLTQPRTTSEATTSSQGNFSQPPDLDDNTTAVPPPQATSLVPHLNETVHSTMPTDPSNVFNSSHAVEMSFEFPEFSPFLDQILSGNRPKSSANSVLVLEVGNVTLRTNLRTKDEVDKINAVNIHQLPEGVTESPCKDSPKSGYAVFKCNASLAASRKGSAFMLPPAGYGPRSGMMGYPGMAMAGAVGTGMMSPYMPYGQEASPWMGYGGSMNPYNSGMSGYMNSGPYGSGYMPTAGAPSYMSPPSMMGRGYGLSPSPPYMPPAAPPAGYMPMPPAAAMSGYGSYGMSSPSMSSGAYPRSYPPQTAWEPVQPSQYGRTMEPMSVAPWSSYGGYMGAGQGSAWGYPY